MHFPVSGVDVNPLIPPLTAFIVSSVTSTAGVAGALLLLPFQTGVLGFVSPAVTPTNLIYNIIAIPGAMARFIREGKMAWILTWTIIIGSLPGMFAGAWIRIRYLQDPDSFKYFVGLVLLYLGVRLLYETFGRSQKGRDHIRKSTDSATGLTGKVAVKTMKTSLLRVQYKFQGETYSFSAATVIVLALAVGVVGGIYGIGGGAIIAPFCVSILGLPVYTVAGPALAGTFFTSIAGVLSFTVFAHAFRGVQEAVSPDWALGILLGIGGFAGTYCGAYLQKFLKERLIKGVLGTIVTGLAVSYIIQQLISL